MKTRLITLFCLLSILALLPLWAAYPASAGSVLPKNKVPGSIESTARRLTNSLRKSGFEVKRGYFTLYTINDCQYSFDVLKTCFYNNPAAPYIFPDVPFWDDEFMDEATINAFGVTEPGYSVTYRFDPREAIVILAKMPPPAKYFGLQTYKFSHQGTYDTTGEAYKFFQSFGYFFVEKWFHTIPGNPERIGALNSLSDPINNVVIEEQSGAVWNELRYFIITPDQSMDMAIREALSKISIADEDIFTERIGTEVIPGYEADAMRVGLDEAADDFSTWMRYAIPEGGNDPGTPGDTWRNNLPMVVLRIRPTRPDWQPVPYPSFVEPEKRTGIDEHQYQEDLDDLVAAVRARWGQPSDTPPPSLYALQKPPSNLIGPLCSEVGMDCLGDNWDAHYQASILATRLDKGEVYAVLGTLGTQTGNANYVALALVNTTMTLGFESINDDKLKDTAQAYSAQVENTDKFFLYYITRNCDLLGGLIDDGNCFSITEDMIPVCEDYQDPTCPMVAFAIREYLFPGTRRGPDTAFILPARVIPLQGPMP